MITPKFEAQKEWVKPTELPNLNSYDEIAIDLETCDPNLNHHMGSGAVIQEGKIVGISVATNDYCRYFPFDHEGGGNMEPTRVLPWFRDLLKNNAVKIFHNAMYDVCWIRSMGMEINGLIVDTMIATSLVDENRMRYDLNSVSKEYLGYGKDELALQTAAKEWGINPKADMWRLPALYVGNYAEKDARVTYDLWQKLKQEIINQDVESIFNLETDLFPCLVDMRFKGVRVQVEKANQTKKQLATKEEQLLFEIKKETNIEPQIWAAASIAKMFDKLKLPYDRTEKTGAPSFTKNFLQNHQHPLVKKIAQAREINKAHTTFIDTIIKHEHHGRIHSEINQLRSDNGGTVTGRFSYQNPNLQQVPARNKELGPLIRSLFIPEEDHKWGCFDYSQQEPRLVVHYASLQNLPGVYDVIESYREGEADFHKIVAEMADIPRSQAKTINLGLFYGMGKAKLQAELGLSTKQEAEALFNQYHDRVPFVRDLMNETSRWASREGEIRTLLGRGCRFNKWEPAQFGMHTPMTWEDAVKKYGENRIRRAFTYKALNKLIQGSAADMTKKSMLDLYKEGIIAHIQIHDELDLSVESKEHANKIIEIMENAVKLAVPNKVDYESGKNWGDIYD